MHNKLISFLSVLLINCLTPVYGAAPGVNPKFEEYTISEIFTGKHADPVANNHTDTLRLRRILAQPINFSGHYIVYTVSCGGGCSMGNVIDAKSGKVVSNLPDEYDTESLMIKYRVNSSLIIITGKSAYGGDVQTNFYNFTGNGFVQLKSVNK